jgi:hypothetical protein
MGKILWLASYPRSGNTWLRAFLHNLLRNPDEPYDINRLQDFTLLEHDARWYRRFDPRPATELTKEEVAALRPKVQEAMTRASPDTVFVKTHNALMEDRGHPLISLPLTAGAVYVVRNPLDVVLSYSAHFGVSLDAAVDAMTHPGTQAVANQAHFVYEVFGSWTENVESWTAKPSPALLVLRYEDMLQTPEATFGRLAGFLGLQPTAERLRRAIEHSSFDRLRAQEQSRGFRERSLKSDRFFREGRSGQWRDLLAPAQIDAVVGACRGPMARFGYLPPAG